MVKKLSCVSYGSLKRFPHTFTTGSVSEQHPSVDVLGKCENPLPIIKRDYRGSWKMSLNSNYYLLS